MLYHKPMGCRCFCSSLFQRRIVTITFVIDGINYVMKPEEYILTVNNNFVELNMASLS